MTRYAVALAVSILLNSGALILMKASVVIGLTEAEMVGISELLGIMFQPLFMAAVACFAAGVVFWIIALRRINLVVAYPTSSLSYAIVALIGVVLFGESMPFVRWMGVLVIMSGVSLMFVAPNRG